MALATRQRNFDVTDIRGNLSIEHLTPSLSLSLSPTPPTQMIQKIKLLCSCIINEKTMTPWLR